MASERSKRKSMTGTVIRARTAKTVVVEVRTMVQHPKYKKYVRTRRRLAAHDEQGKCGVGDRVQIIESRPISKTKRWRVARVVVKSKTVVQ